MYYLRTKAASQAVQFTVEKQGGKMAEPLVNAAGTQMIGESETAGQSCSMEEGCVTCSA
jgi:ribonucleoside-diphosphate reductase alpha chain